MYTLITYILIPFAIIRLAWRSLKDPDYFRHIPERFGYYNANSKDDSIFVWIHAVSVGEVFTCQPLVKAINEKHPNKNLLISITTPTGRQTANSIFSRKNIKVVYLPFDVPFAINKFIRHFGPKIGILMETEIWPNLIKLCKQSDIPLNLVNARLSRQSARRYARFPRMSKNIINQLNIVGAQTRNDAKRFKFFRSRVIHVTGSMKFDREIPKNQLDHGLRLKKKYGMSRQIFLLASTKPGEEELIIDKIVQLKNIENLLIVIVPRHPNRCDKIDRLLKERSITTQRVSRTVEIDKNTEVVLGDEIGNLVAYYHACDVAFVGGSLLPYGGQNFMEACSAGRPVIVGQYTFNFEEFAKEAVRKKAILRIYNEIELINTAKQLLNNQITRRQMGNSGLKFFHSKQGATKITYNLLKPSFTIER